jgi:hypothetical protein
MKNIDISSLFIFGITFILYTVVFYYVSSIPRKHAKVINSNKFSLTTKTQMLFNIAIRTPSIHTIVYVLLGLFILTWMSLLLIVSIWFQGLSKETYMAFATAFSTPILGFCGQVQYIRNESPGRILDESIREPLARLIGGSTMLLGYGGTIVSLVYGLILWAK